MATLTAVRERYAPQSIGQVADAVRSAREEATPLRIVGSGTWLDAGHPVHAARTLDLSSLAGIVEYVPGDLTLTARAGTTLAEIADATSAHRQWLPLDPFGDSGSTLGATLATASAGPLGGSIGMPRDVTVGLTFVAGDGDIVHGGGRVVKNVAGFDLVRLTIGAWGTLGVITEATVRLRALPEADETIAITLPVEPDAVATLLSTVRVAAVEPLATELLNPACADGLGLGNQGVMLVRLAGNSVSVLHQRSNLARLASCAPAPNDVWQRLQQSDPAGGGVVRLSRRPSELARLWSFAMSMTDVDAHASLSRGVVRLRMAGPIPLFMSSDSLDRIVFERQPAGSSAATGLASIDEFQAIVPRSVVVDPISRRLRDAFDPARILNRGILGAESP